jgi:hypothetical protein
LLKPKLQNGIEKPLDDTYRNIAPWDKERGMAEPEDEHYGKIQSYRTRPDRQAIVIAYLPSQLRALKPPTLVKELPEKR